VHQKLKEGAEVAFARAAPVARAGRLVNKIGRVVETPPRAGEVSPSSPV